MNSIHVSQNSNKKIAEPWYKNHVVLLMLTLPLVVVLASFITLYLAIKTNDGVLDDDYYKQGLAINQDLARDNQAKTLGLTAQLQIKGPAVELKMTSLATAALAGQPIKMSLQNMASKTEDSVLTLVPAGEGVWRGELKKQISTGHWHIQLEAQDWRLTQTVVGGMQSPISFSAK
ncbi:FixH family protein [Hydromonas duriensis]|uniref:Nitrogen fixation protein FixH n=1 Tax=Hydromonas duriensis TaxID=1527608 RepID=A0A4R6YBU9_9BURK|nr:FixH family protein [Hydromonas duriensis]TDR33135.1 hypothetical protein DFR44_101188 [Hydromonas duriensis]